VSSIRFNSLREGIEDYEYIWMLKNKGAADFADEIVKNMVIDVSTFSRNLAELYLSRKAMARKLVQLTKMRTKRFFLTGIILLLADIYICQRR
jgi:hypothetical protein